MADYVVHYFDLRGRAELLRLVLTAAGQDFVDKRHTQDEWKAFKASTPLGQMPVLEYKGQMYCQAMSLARFAAKQNGLGGKDNVEQLKADMIVDTMFQEIVKKMGDMVFMEKDEEKKKTMKEQQAKDFPGILEKVESWVEGDHFLASGLSWADLVLVDVEPWLLTIHPTMSWPKKLEAILARVKAHPRIAEYLEKRPETKF